MQVSGCLYGSFRPIAGGLDRQLAGGTTQLQAEVVRGIRQRAHSSPADLLRRMTAMKGTLDIVHDWRRSKHHQVG